MTYQLDIINSSDKIKLLFYTPTDAASLQPYPVYEFETVGLPFHWLFAQIVIAMRYHGLCGCCDVTWKQTSLKAQCKQGISVDWLLRSC